MSKYLLACKNINKFNTNTQTEMIELTDKNVETTIVNVFYVSENKNSIRREMEDKIMIFVSNIWKFNVWNKNILGEVNIK